MHACVCGHMCVQLCGCTYVHGAFHLFCRILVFGRLCRGLTECCPSLHELLSGLDGGSGGPCVGGRFRPRLFSAKEKEVCRVYSGKDVATCVDCYVHHCMCRAAVSM